MLLTLAANSLRSRLASKRGRGAPADAITVTDLPRVAREQLQLFGLHLTTPMLAGADLSVFDAVREAADKAACPCLTLTEPEALPFTSDDDRAGDGAVERAIRVVRAAHRLGCNAVGITIKGDAEGDTLDFCIERIRAVVAVADRLEINILLAPGPGITAEPDRATDLIKRIGGFRVGTYPDFETASKQADPSLYLRRIVPYASAVTVACRSFKPGPKPGTFVHEPYDLGEYVRVLEAVGYSGTLAIDYRGEGDPAEGVRTARVALERLLGPAISDDELEGDELEDVELEEEDDAAEEDQP